MENSGAEGDIFDDEPDFEDDLAGTQLTSEAKEIDADIGFEVEPDNLLEDDFEQELGGSTIFTSQDMINEEFSNIARLNVVQVVGDDRFGKKVIVFYACRLPPTNEIDLSRLWMYIVKTLSQFVSNDYSLVYFHHGLNSKNNPGLKFLINAYRHIDRDFKKNLKNLFIVHPTNLLKFIVNALLPLFSTKVKRKIVKIQRLQDLEAYFYVDQMGIPEVVRDYDSRLYSSSNTLTSDVSEPSISSKGGPTIFERLPQSQFGVSLQHIRQYYPKSKVPPILEECVTFLSKPEWIQMEGIFRRSPSKTLLEETQLRINRGETVNLAELGPPHLAASLIKTFLRSLEEPLMTFELYDDIVNIHSNNEGEAVEHIRRMVSEMLPDYNYVILKYLVDFLILVDSYSTSNKMFLGNLANVFAPNLIWSRNEASLAVISIFIRFTNLLLENHDKIFLRDID